MSSILWYVHDHGSGHLHRAMAVVPHISAPVVVAAGPGIAPAARQAFGSTTVSLPSDVAEPVGVTQGPWHYAPQSAAVRARTLALAAAVEQHECATVVVDVSVEATVLCRLLGVRVVTVRQSGRRDDRAHRIGFDSADVVWVPQHRDLEPLGRERVDARWQFTGAFSRLDGNAERPVPVGARRCTVVLMVGRGGHSFDLERFRQGGPIDGWRVVVVGADGPAETAAVEVAGRVDDIGPLLREADVVITSAGWAAVADVVAAGARLVVVAEQRPFAEQTVRARALHDRGLALHLDEWPTAERLPAVLERAMSLDVERWRPFYDGCGAQRAAALIDDGHAS